MIKNLDGKFGVRVEPDEWNAEPPVVQVVNLVSGEPIPDDEPIFILRARDLHAVRTLFFYHDQCSRAATNELHSTGMEMLIRKFMEFAKQHPERMKQPTSTGHLKLENI